MSRHSIPGLVRKRGLALAIVAAALGVAFASPAKAQTTWTITVDVTGASSKPTYTETHKPTNANSIPCNIVNNNVAELTICHKDTVLWITKAGAAHNHVETIIIHGNAILDDASGNATLIHRGKNNDVIGGPIHRTTPPGATDKYYVVVSDGPTPHLDDPKIIVGGGPPLEEVDERLDEIEKQLKAQSDKIDQILGDLERLKNAQKNQ